MSYQEVELSSEFKSKATKSIIAIAFFILVYLVILAGAVGLTLGCIYLGLNVILIYPMFLTIILGIGIISMGVLILAFLLKFILQSKKTDRSHLVEIQRNEEPKLFVVIDEIVKQVGTSSPKKVYLSGDVNASVFYDSNFWSMFFPIRKNLQIGLGLVNSITEPELKAILSHEFGHFSQKSMKVGSYVYNVNQVIFGIVNDDGSYGRFVQGMASISGLVSIFVMLAVGIVNSINWILRKMYELINKSYMGLSREMEFHADEIAANLTGYKPLKDSLLRMPMADLALNMVLGKYNETIADNIRSRNVFKEQFYMMNHIASQNEIPVLNNLPVVTIEEVNRFNKSKLVVDDQWASHPSTEERIERMEQLDLPVRESQDTSANSIFTDIERTQENITDNIFSVVTYENEPQLFSLQEFIEDYKMNFQKMYLDKYYRGYYDDYSPKKFDLPEWSSNFESIQIDKLFSDKNTDLIYVSMAMNTDLEIINQIISRQIPIKTFDYDGKKYKRKQAVKLSEEIKNELENIEKEILDNDNMIYSYFLNFEKENRDFHFLESKYKVFFKSLDQQEEKFEVSKNMHEKLEFIHQNVEYDLIKVNFGKAEGAEKKLKEGICEMLNNKEHIADMATATKNNFENYVSQSLVYFDSKSYKEEALGILFSAINDYAFHVSKELFFKKKALLEYQMELLNNSNG